jgi:hypothetical protein
MKIPIHVWKQVRRIQREFLWGGRRGRKKINWIKWDVVCLPKKKGGLGVRDVRAVNISLLTKWRWRLLHDDASLWKDMLKSKYGVGIIDRTELGEDYKPWFTSSWWRDINNIRFGNKMGVDMWFGDNVVKIIGDKEMTLFWMDNLVDVISLKSQFGRLFKLCLDK